MLWMLCQNSTSALGGFDKHTTSWSLRPKARTASKSNCICVFKSPARSENTSLFSRVWIPTSTHLTELRKNRTATPPG